MSKPEADLVAEYLLAHEALLERFLAQPISHERGVCPLYDAENLEAHCTVYPARPLLCRTFAFSAHRDKTGEPVYAPCHKFRESAELAPRVEQVRAPSLPILPDDSLAIWSMDPQGDALPMGPAIRRAVDAARLKRSFQQG